MIEQLLAFEEKVRQTNPPHFVEWYQGFRVGICGGGRHTELDSGHDIILNPAEAFMVQEIEGFLAKGRDVCALDLGARLAFSFNVVGTQFPDAIASGKLRLFATNVEDDFTFEQGIAEAQRRLELRAAYPTEIATFEGWDLSDDDYASRIRSRYQEILSPVEITYLEEHRCVTYVNDVDTVSLPVTFGGGSMLIIHEYFGGLKNHIVDPLRAIGAVVDTLDPNGGIIITPSFVAMLHNDPVLQRLGVLSYELPWEYNPYGERYVAHMLPGAPEPAVIK